MITGQQMLQLRKHPSYRSVKVRYFMDSPVDCPLEVLSLDDELFLVLTEDGTHDEYYRVLYKSEEYYYYASYAADTLDEMTAELVEGGGDEDDMVRVNEVARRRLRVIVDETRIPLGGLLPDNPFVDLFEL